jgi:hypothetical protein
MGTRAIYTFAGLGEEYHVYKHYDGYPTGAAEFLKAALTRAWTLPRYEPDEFAAAFIAANKTGEGDIRIAHSRYWAADVEYGYTVSPSKKGPTVRVVATNYRDEKKTEHLIWEGDLLEFIVEARAIQEKYFAE